MTKTAFVSETYDMINRIVANSILSSTRENFKLWTFTKIRTNPSKKQYRKLSFFSRLVQYQKYLIPTNDDDDVVIGISISVVISISNRIVCTSNAQQWKIHRKRFLLKWYLQFTLDIVTLKQCILHCRVHTVYYFDTFKAYFEY